MVQNKLYDHIFEVFGLETEDLEQSFPDLGARKNYLFMITML